MRPSQPFSWVIVVLSLMSAYSLRADDRSEFEKARNSFSSGAYEEAAKRFEELLGPTHAPLADPHLLEQARIYHAAALIALNRGAAADDLITLILLANPAAMPDSAAFPTAVLDRFVDVRGRIRADLEAKAREQARQARLERERLEEMERRERRRIRLLEKLASHETSVATHSRWIATIPFGVGQFQNGDSGWGWTFLSLETALAASSIVSGAVIQSLQARGAEPNIDVHALNDRLATWKQVNNYSFFALGTVVVGGIAHAHLTFVPDVRKTIPRKPGWDRVGMDLLVHPNFVGVAGQF